MKRTFITTISNQRNLTKCHYETEVENLKYAEETAYPVVHQMINNIEPGDEVELIAINFPDNPEANYNMLKEEITKIEEKFDIKIDIKEISRGLDETEAEHINLFKELLQKIEDCTTIYADLTYGTKPTPMVISFVLFWIELIRKYSEVAQLVYGRVFWVEVIDDEGNRKSVLDKAQIYDVTRIHRIIKLSHDMDAVGGENVEKAIFEILKIGGDE